MRGLLPALLVSSVATARALADISSRHTADAIVFQPATHLKQSPLDLSQQKPRPIGDTDSLLGLSWLSPTSVRIHPRLPPSVPSAQATTRDVSVRISRDPQTRDTTLEISVPRGVSAIVVLNHGINVRIPPESPGRRYRWMLSGGSGVVRGGVVSDDDESTTEQGEWRRQKELEEIESLLDRFRAQCGSLVKGIMQGLSGGKEDIRWEQDYALWIYEEVLAQNIDAVCDEKEMDQGIEEQVKRCLLGRPAVAARVSSGLADGLKRRRRRTNPWRSLRRLLAFGMAKEEDDFSGGKAFAQLGQLVKEWEDTGAARKELFEAFEEVHDIVEKKLDELWRADGGRLDAAIDREYWLAKKTRAEADAENDRTTLELVHHGGGCIAEYIRRERDRIWVRLINEAKEEWFNQTGESILSATAAKLFGPDDGQGQKAEFIAEQRREHARRVEDRKEAARVPAYERATEDYTEKFADHMSEFYERVWVEERGEVIWRLFLENVNDKAMWELGFLPLGVAGDEAVRRWYSERVRILIREQDERRSEGSRWKEYAPGEEQEGDEEECQTTDNL